MKPAPFRTASPSAPLDVSHHQDRRANVDEVLHDQLELVICVIQRRVSSTKSVVVDSSDITRSIPQGT